jgi:hypothetical protein
MSDEVWKPIPGFPGYEVSDQGRVRSYWQQTFHKGQPGSTQIRVDEPQRILQTTLSAGYQRVCLAQNGHYPRIRVHRLVLLAFVGPCPPGMESCHNDGIRSNSCLTNLRWDTPSNNQLDRRKHGLDRCGPFGAKRAGAKLTDALVIQIREMAVQGRSNASLGRQFGVSTTVIWHIVHRNRWRHLP